MAKRGKLHDVDSDLRVAIEAVAEALGLLRTAPNSAAAVAVVDQAQAAVGALPSDPTATALQRIVTQIKDSHRTSTPTSTEPESGNHAVVVALHIGRSWSPRTTR
jgi:hypothetical protein